MSEAVYLDSSVVLGHILGETGRTLRFKSRSEIYTSELTQIECLRTLDRLRLLNQWTDKEVIFRLGKLQEMGDYFNEVSLQPSILKRAGMPLPVPVKTLDALHLVTALEVANEIKTKLIFLTHDVQQRAAATACGFQTEVG